MTTIPSHTTTQYADAARYTSLRGEPMDDKEIIKAWYLLVYNKCYEPGCNPTEEQAAIRLYRMAETNTGLDYEKLLLKQDINYEHLLKKARASERERLLPLVKIAALWYIQPSSKKEAEQDIEKVFRTKKKED
jgi:hypothetical protein